MNKNDIDIHSFPNVGNNPFYNKEFSVGAMLPQIPLYDSNVICASIRPYADGLDLQEYDLQKVRNYMETSMASTIEKDHKQKGKKSLSQFQEVLLTESERKSLTKEYPFLRHYYGSNGKYNDDGHTTVLWKDKNKLVAAICVSDPSKMKQGDNDKWAGHIWLENFEIVPEYRGYGLSDQILEYAISKHHVDALGVAHDNEIAKRLYEKHGFKYGDKSGKNNILMFKESVEEPPPTQKGFWMAHHEGEAEVWNSLVIQNGKRYREKVEILILNGDSVLLRLVGKNEYKIPGGSTEPKETLSKAAIRECQEEVRITPKNIKYYGPRTELYINGIDYDGYIAHIFVAQYDKKFTGYVAPEDVDELLLKESRFYKINSVNLLPQHRAAINQYMIDIGSMTESTDELIQENWLMIQDDLKLNLDQWAPGNPLWITGASGDGKSTLAANMARAYNAEVVTSDIVLLRVGHSKEKYMAKLQKAQNSHGVVLQNSPALDYVNSHPNLPTGIFNPVTKDWDDARLAPQMLAFYFWFMQQAATNPRYNKRLLIIEGCDISQMPPEIMVTKPLIVVGGSRLRSLWRRAKRDMGEKNTGMLKAIFKYISRYNKSNRALDDNKEFFRAGIELMSEAVKRSELPDEVFGIPQERKYPMPDEKHTRSAMKLFNHCEKKYEKQLAKHIIKNIRKYDIDPSFVGPKNRLRKYLVAANLITEGVINVEDTNYLLDKMLYDFFGETTKSDAEILFDKFFGEASMGEDIKIVPDRIEPMVKKLENKHYRVKYASPGHANTRFDNDRNKDGVINGKLVSTGRIIFEKDYHFDSTPDGWEWKKLSNGFRALYVKPFTYSGPDGKEKEAFKKWQDDYMGNLLRWVEDLPMQDSDHPRNKPDEDDEGNDE